MYIIIIIKTHSIASRCVIGPENILFAGTSLHLKARKFYRLYRVVKGLIINEKLSVS